MALTITKGKIKQPEMVLIHGVDGVGKSTLAAGAPDPFYIASEKGTSNLNVTRAAVASMSEAREAVLHLLNTKHSHGTAVLDTLDHLEALMWDEICKEKGVQNIEHVDGGYGKGYVEANRRWREFYHLLERLRTEKGMHVIIIAHSHIKAFQDPQANAAYDRYILKLNDKAAGIWRELVDTVLFMNYETLTKEEKGQKKAKAFGNGDRILYTERRPAFDAKNRDGLPFSIELPDPKLDGKSPWQAYMEAKAASNPAEIKAIKADIQNLKGMLAKDDPTLPKIEAYIKEIGDDIDKNIGVRNRLRTLTGQN